MTVAPPPVLMSSFGVAKHGNADAEWEDSAAHSEGHARFAVADGAAAAYQAGVWSHLLTGGFITDPFAIDNDPQFIEWWRRRAGEWQEMTRVDDDPPYYVQHAQRRGSHATLLCVELRPGPSYLAGAVGDTCLLHARGGRIRSAFPVESADSFGYRPDLIPTNQTDPPTLARASGTLESGDVLIGATDAAAEWLLRARAASCDEPLSAVLGATQSMDEVVASARRSGGLRNDDVAIVRCLVGDVDS